MVSHEGFLGELSSLHYNNGLENLLVVLLLDSYDLNRPKEVKERYTLKDHSDPNNLELGPYLGPRPPFNIKMNFLERVGIHALHPGRYLPPAMDEQ